MRWGKDTMAEYLRDNYNLKFASSSQKALDVFLYDVLKNKYNLKYNSRQEAFEDRVNHRPIWKDEISNFNDPNPYKLASIIMEDNDIYVGMRDPKELSRDIFDLVVWVDSSKRLKEESSDSMLMKEEMADYVIDNNSSIENFYKNIDSFVKEHLGLDKIN